MNDKNFEKTNEIYDHLEKNIGNLLNHAFETQYNETLQSISRAELNFVSFVWLGQDNKFSIYLKDSKYGGSYSFTKEDGEESVLTFDCDIYKFLDTLEKEMSEEYLFSGQDKYRKNLANRLFQIAEKLKNAKDMDEQND